MLLSPKRSRAGPLLSGRKTHWVVPVFYVDGHRKPVHANALIPCGPIGRRGKIGGCRALVVLHDHEGHPLLVTTHRGDQHLIRGLPAILTHYEQATGMVRLKRIVVDREGMAAEFLAALISEGRTVVTILRIDQYAGLEAFREVGEFVPLQEPRQYIYFRLSTNLAPLTAVSR